MNIRPMYASASFAEQEVGFTLKQLYIELLSLDTCIADLIHTFVELGLMVGHTHMLCLIVLAVTWHLC